MNPQLLAIDLDGTLLDPHGNIPHAAMTEIRRARGVGVEIVIATGRSWIESREFLQEIDADGVMIAAGGAMLVEAATGHTLVRSVLSSDILLEVIHRLNTAGHLAHLLQDHAQAEVDYIMVGDMAPDPTTQWWLSKHGLTVRSTSEVTRAELAHTVRAGAVGPANSLDQIVQELELELGEQALIRHWEAVAENTCDGEKTYLLEIFSPEVDKWSMVQRVLEDRGLQTQDVVAIGDGLNDIHMLRCAGQGIAMGQANKDVRTVADRVVASNADDGLAEAIRSVLPP